VKKLTLPFSGTVIALILCLLPVGLVLADPGVTLDMLISVDDGATWEDAPVAPGAITTEGEDIFFQYTITNTGDSAFDYTLNDLLLYSASGTLAPSEVITLESAAQTALSGQNSNIATVVASGTDQQGAPFEITAEDTVYYYGIPLPTEVVIDIKPGSDPNSINLHSRGVTPVALLSVADEFDATTIDVSAINFAGASPVHWAIEDVNGDGIDDMILHFKTQELELDESSTEATLDVTSLDEVIGENVVSFTGSGSVNIVPDGNAFGHSNGNGGNNGNAYGHNGGNNGNAYGHNK